MKPMLDEWTIVVVGSWNIAILNPEWVGREMLSSQEIEVELLFGAVRPQVKINSPSVSVIPAPNRVVINARQPSPDSLAEAEAATARMLEKLPVTPVTALGINFGYVEELMPVSVAQLFRIGDTCKISDVPLTIKSTSIKRRFDYDGRDLNFRLTQTEDAKLTIHFNYHISTNSAAAAKEALLGKVLMFQQHSQELTRQLYELELEGDTPQ
jgi:hypothetical protein